MFPIDGLTLNAGDRLLTLSTCSYETSNARTIVHARLIRKNGEMVAEPTGAWTL
jgi:sortase (surface protein transpeptidase)